MLRAVFCLMAPVFCNTFGGMQQQVIRYFFVMVLGAFGTLAAAQHFPSLAEVAQHFYTNYQKAPNNLGIVHFEKRPAGWFVGEQALGAPNWASHCIWNVATALFQEVPFKKNNKQIAPTALAQMVATHQNSNYNLQLFFGYRGWCADVMAHYATQPAKTDSAIYALARAYATCASDLLNNNSGLANLQKQFPLHLQKGKMTTQQAAQFIDLKMQALTLFTQLANENPQFLTTVGNIELKRDQEFVATYLELAIYADLQQARRFLPKDLFGETTTVWAKQILATCADGGIYLAWGDNDLYPLLYVQEIEGYRTDVAIVSLPLLQNVAYLKFVQTELPFGQWPIKNWADFEGANKEIFLLNTTGSIQMDALMAQIAQKQPLAQLTTQADYIQLHNKDILMAHAGDTLRVQLANGLVSRAYLAVLSAIAADEWAHTWYFSGFSSPAWLQQFSGQMAFAGFLYELRPNYQQGPYVDGFSYVDAETYFTWLFKTFEWNSQYQKKEGFENKIRQIRLAGVLAVMQYLDAKKTAQATTLLEELVYRWPNDSLRFEWVLYPMVEAYLRLGDATQAIATAATITQNLQQQQPKKEAAIKLAAYQYNAFTKEMQRLAKTYGVPQLSDL